MATHGSTDRKPRVTLLERTGTSPVTALRPSERDDAPDGRFVGRAREAGELELARAEVRSLRAQLARVLRVATVERPP